MAAQAASPAREGRVVHAQAASAIAIAGSVTVRTAPGPFVAQPDLPLAEQMAGQAEYLNRLHAWMAREIEQRDQAIQEERERAQAELAAERTRVDGLLSLERERFSKLHKLMTSGTGLRWLAALVLVVGTAFSTWPNGWARVWPAWLSTTTLVFLVACSAAAWICWLIETRLRADRPGLEPDPVAGQPRLEVHGRAVPWNTLATKLSPASSGMVMPMRARSSFEDSISSRKSAGIPVMAEVGTISRKQRPGDVGHRRGPERDRVQPAEAGRDGDGGAGDGDEPAEVFVLGVP
jgi:hypothetical protein